MIKKGIQVVILFSVLFGLSNCKKTEKDILYSKTYIKEIKQVRKKASSFIISSFIPGASVAVIKDGELIYSEGFGYASEDLEVRAKRETKYRIGTLSELFTNVIYQKLLEEGTLHPDSTIQYYYPDFPEKKYKLTVDHLAQQTSGIRAPKGGETNSMSLNVTIEKGLEVIKQDPLLGVPGDYQTPSFFNYNILGVVMEKATHKPFHQLLKEYVTDTLHLENIVIDNPFGTIKHRSDFYGQNYIAQLINNPTLDLRHRAPSDGLLSNAEDLAKLGNSILNSDYLSQETKERIFKPIPLINEIPSQMANSWLILTDRKERAIYGKSGSVSGGGSALLVYPEENLIISFVCNLTAPENSTLVFEIANVFLDENN